MNKNFMEADAKNNAMCQEKIVPRQFHVKKKIEPIAKNIEKTVIIVNIIKLGSSDCI